MFDISTMPKTEYDGFLHWIVSVIEAYYEDPENKREFEEWLKEEEEKENNKITKAPAR